jgi:Fe-S-cluster-containing hydrogenase component 2
MERKGLVFVEYAGKEPEYTAIPWTIGIHELQINRLDAAAVTDLDEFEPVWWDQSGWDKVPQLRTIPIGESIDTQLEVMPYERAGHLIRAHDEIAVAPCICRQTRHAAGEGCDTPVETCLMMGSAATFYVKNGLARTIDQEEAQAILERAEELGLVLQPGNAKDAGSLCTCCGCCCDILKASKRHPKPAETIASPFVAALDVALCEGCGTCEDRCQMEAIYLDNGHAALDLDRCIGCGLCVPSCPAAAVRLRRKPEAEQPYVPKDLADTLIRLGQAQGKLSTGDLVGMLVRSKVDRLLAPRA